MRVASWNILNRADDWTAKAHAITRLLAEADVDVAALQETPATARKPLSAAFAAAGYVISFNPIPAGRADGCAVAWRTAMLTESRTMAVSDVDCAIQRFTDNLTVCSYHGIWGATMQGERLRETRLLDRLLPHDGITLLLGDFNASAGESAVRLLAGLTEAGTYWTEAQETALMLGRLDRSLPTALPGTAPKAAETGRTVGLNPAYLPGRRIDFMFSRGWNYGRRGGWTGCFTAEATDLSDHALLAARLLA